MERFGPPTARRFTAHYCAFERLAHWIDTIHSRAAVADGR